MNKKPERQGSATSGQALAAQYSQLLGTQQLGTEIMASIARTNGFGESFASAQRAGIEAANKVMKSQQTGAELVANVVRAQGTSESFACAQRQVLEMASNLAGTQRLAGAFASARVVAAAQISRSFPVLGAIGVAAFTQAMAVHLEPSSGMRWFNTAMQAGGVAPLAGVLPPVFRNWDIIQVFRPLLETPECRQLGAVGEDLVQWVAGRLVGSAEASSGRFEEIADSLENVELDEESVRQLEGIVQDESEIRKASKLMGLPFIPKSLGGDPGPIGRRLRCPSHPDDCGRGLGSSADRSHFRRHEHGMDRGDSYIRSASHVLPESAGSDPGNGIPGLGGQWPGGNLTQAACERPLEGVQGVCGCSAVPVRGRGGF